MSGEATEAHMKVTAKMLDLLEQAGLPVPEEIEYGDTEVRLLWNEAKVAVVVELDDEEET